MLAPETLSHVAATVGGGLRMRAALDEPADVAPLLRELASAVDPALAPLAEEIGRCVEDDGSDLRDTASPLLRRLRKELRDGRQRATEELRRLARSSKLREHLQEDFVTQRGGRPVLAREGERAGTACPASSTTRPRPGRRSSSSRSRSSS